MSESDTEVSPATVPAAEVAKEYFTSAEITKRGIFPKGKKIIKTQAWDKRWENYYVGIYKPSINENDLVGLPVIYFYDQALDEVLTYNYQTKKWESTPAAARAPKMAYEKTKDGKIVHVGIVEDEPKPKKQAMSFSDFLEDASF